MTTQNIFWFTPTPLEEARCQNYIVSECMKRSRQRGDGAWRESESITGLGDVLDADHGEPPMNAKW